MDSVDLFLIDRNQLFRQGLKRLLAETAFSVRGEAKDLKEAQQHFPDGPPPAVIVIDLADSNDDDLARLKSLRETLPSRIVVLTGDVNQQRVLEVIRIGVQGYITKDISFDALVQVLRLAMLGEEIFSSRLLTVVTERLSSIGETPQTDVCAAELSIREKRVLSFLSSGCSNDGDQRSISKDPCERLAAQAQRQKSHANRNLGACQRLFQGRGERGRGRDVAPCVDPLPTWTAGAGVSH
jgi:two-component system, NarL family, nitrate/nitrite response regulator NarL